MQAHNEDWLISSSELAAYFAQSGHTRGLLSFLPEADGAIDTDIEVNETFSGLNEDQRVLFDNCLQVMGDPARVVRLHYNIADFRVSRSALAVSSELPGLWVTLGGSIDPLRLSIRSEGELHLLVSRVLSALKADVRATLLGCDFSTEAGIVLLAVLDQIRRSFLISLIRHLEPITVFSTEDIIDRLAESEEEDFRWALNFVNKLLPFPVKEMAVAKDPLPALLELVKAEIIEAVDDDGASFDLTEAGRLLVETYRMAESRVVMSSTYLTPNKEIIHEVFFLFRSPTDLFLVQMSGAEASLVSMLPADLEALLRYIFTTPQKITTEEQQDTSEEIVIDIIKHTPDSRKKQASTKKPSAVEDKSPQPSVRESDQRRKEQPVLWYIYKDQQQHGPFVWEDLYKKASTGLLGMDDLVWSEGMAEWIRGRDVPELFSSTTASPRQFCRHCGQPVSPAATFCGQCGEKI